MIVWVALTSLIWYWIKKTRKEKKTPKIKDIIISFFWKIILKWFDIINYFRKKDKRQLNVFYLFLIISLWQG